MTSIDSYVNLYVLVIPGKTRESLMGVLQTLSTRREAPTMPANHFHYEPTFCLLRPFLYADFTSFYRAVSISCIEQTAFENREESLERR